MVPPKDLSSVLQALLDSIVKEHDFHLDTGILGTRYLLDVLTEYGFSETAFKIAAQKTYPGWGYMIAEGATSLWERWEKITGDGMNSHNHIMLGSIDAWFYRAVAGLSCSGPGWSRILISPPAWPGLDFAAASVFTVRGEVSVSWRKDKTSFRLRTRIPVGGRAHIRLPLPWKKCTLQVDGREQKGFIEGTKTNVDLRRGSGEHIFLLKKLE
jgi:alpha-L-rhamnosidase